MEVNELNKLSPIRAFDEAIAGGLGRGNLGVLVSRHGVGKTACLVHLAIDKIFHGENVIHVSFSGNVEHIVNWYKEVFRQITEKRPLQDASGVYEKVLANRVVMNFSQDNIPVEKVLASLTTLIQQGSFNADTIMFDGYRLAATSEDDIKKIKQFAKEMKLEVWFSVSPVRSEEGEFDKYGVPHSMEPYMNLFDVLVGLKYNDRADKVIMTVVIDHGKPTAMPMGVALDPKTMLISR